MAVVTGSDILRRARALGSITQAELHRRSGVSQANISSYENGRSKPAFETLVRLVGACGFDLDVGLVRRPLSGPLGVMVLHCRDAVLEIIERAGGENVRVFGSVARGEDGHDSDVDLLVDFSRPIGLLGISRAQHELEDLLGAPVDLVPERLLASDIQEAARRDQVAL